MDIPYNNITALRNEIYHGWMRPPRSRSTTDILWTCSATIVLCVYTAVHLNIPEPGEPVYRQIFRRVKWIVVAILAPEIVLLAAWKQFNDARRLQRSLKQHARTFTEDRSASTSSRTELVTERVINPPDDHILSSLLKDPASASVNTPDEVPEPDRITLTYSFYAIMGGFRIRVPRGESAGETFTLTPSAIDDFAKAGFFWNVSTKSIEDRSKADSLAKLLAAVQVGWMLFNCVARKAQQLPLALLELHTFIHAVCAALMFALWFKKPMNIRYATVKESAPDVDDLVLGLLAQSSSNEDGVESRLTSRRANIGRDDLFGTDFWARLSQLEPIDLGVEPILGSESPGDVTTYTYKTVLGIIIVQALYGSLHAVAWDSQFPTIPEHHLWRISCVTVAAACFCFLAASWCCYEAASAAARLSSDAARTLKDSKSQIYPGDRIHKYFLNWGIRISVRILDIVADPHWFTLVCLSLVPAIAGMLARAYIVVESVISLRSVPIGVYAAVTWTDYIPHI